MSDFNTCIEKNTIRIVRKKEKNKPNYLYIYE